MKSNGTKVVVCENQFVAFPDAEDDAEESEKSEKCEPRRVQQTNTNSMSQKGVNDSAEDLLSRETDEAFDQLESKLGREFADGSADCLDSVGEELADNPDCPSSRRWFLDTRAMCSSPSANYYKPTEEPEPWDLTQLNIEASVMCLVSKVKFLCGRCSSPAVRLRSSGAIARSNSLRGGLYQVQGICDFIQLIKYILQDS